MLLFGLGIGSSFPSLMTLAMSGATPEDAGLASGLVNTSAQVGGALGLAVLATLSATRTSHLLAGGSSNADALVGGYHLAFVIGAGLMALPSWSSWPSSDRSPCPPSTCRPSTARARLRCSSGSSPR